MTGGILDNNRLIWVLAVALALLIVDPAAAYTPWNGLYFLENTYATKPDSSTNLFKTGANLSFRPPTKKSLDARVNIRLDYTNADGESLWNLSPIGNLGVDLAGDNYSVNLQHLRTATVTTDAELVESMTYRASLTLFPDYWPRITTSYSHLEQVTDGENTSTSDLYSIYADYDFRKWLNFRAGYDFQTRSTGVSNPIESNSMLFGIGINREILPRTLLVGDVNFTRNTSDSDGGFSSSTNNYGLRLGIDSRPTPWVGLSGHFSTDTASSESRAAQDVTTTSRFYDLTATVYPLHGVRVWSTVGNRTFDGETDRRSVDFVTLGGGVNRDLGEKVSLNLSATRTMESDPDQGDNTRDSLGLNSLLDLTPRVSLRFNLNVSRNEFPGFVRIEGFDVSGPLADRDIHDNELAGFTFFDTDNNDLYTKNSILFADWSAPVRLDPPTDEKFIITKSLQGNLQVTDNMSLILYYSINSSADTLDLLEIDRQTLNGSLIYQPNRRTSYSLTGNYSSSASGSNNYNGTFSVNYRFIRGNQLSLSYGLRNFNEETADTFTGSLRLALRKHNNIELVYGGTEMFKDDQTDFIRVRYTHSF